MRVISGEYGGRRLKAVPGQKTRPTTDKVKEAIYNMIGPYYQEGICLDLFAGSGGLSIEAISRGMSHAYLVDRQAAAIKTIHENIAVTKEPEKFTVLKMDAKRVPQYLADQGIKLDLVLLDPPYREQTIIETLSTLVTLNLLAESALIVCETDEHVALPAQILTLNCLKSQNYGISKVTIYEQEEGSQHD